MNTQVGVTRPTESKDLYRETFDIRGTMREVHAMGSTLFEGRQKKDYEAERYKALTGRDKKQQRVPLKISRGIKRKAAVRDARRLNEAREAGIIVVSKKTETKTREHGKHAKLYGPAPSVGFTKKGVLHVRKPVG